MQELEAVIAASKQELAAAVAKAATVEATSSQQAALAAGKHPVVSQWVQASPPSASRIAVVLTLLLFADMEDQLRLISEVTAALADLGQDRTQQIQQRVAAAQSLLIQHTHPALASLQPVYQELHEAFGSVMQDLQAALQDQQGSDQARLDAEQQTAAVTATLGSQVQALEAARQQAAESAAALEQELRARCGELQAAQQAHQGLAAAKELLLQEAHSQQAQLDTATAEWRSCQASLQAAEDRIQQLQELASGMTTAEQQLALLAEQKAALSQDVAVKDTTIASLQQHREHLERRLAAIGRTICKRARTCRMHATRMVW
jgi:chromosome segregation ATPase